MEKQTDYARIYEETLSILRNSGDIKGYPPEEQKVLSDILKLKGSLEEMYIHQEEEDMQDAAFRMAEEERELEELQACKEALIQAFPKSFINEKDEFIAHLQSNQYICMGDCKKPIDIKCKVLEWFSRPAHKGQPYSQEWKNRQFRKFMLDGINNFLDTTFTEADMEEIYIALGNAINHQKTLQFIKSGCDMYVLTDAESED